MILNWKKQPSTPSSSSPDCLHTQGCNSDPIFIPRHQYQPILKLKQKEEAQPCIGGGNAEQGLPCLYMENPVNLRKLEKKTAPGEQCSAKGSFRGQ